MSSLFNLLISLFDKRTLLTIYFGTVLGENWLALIFHHLISSILLGGVIQEDLNFNIYIFLPYLKNAYLHIHINYGV